MKTRYFDLIDQTFNFPQKEFSLEGDELRFHGMPLMDLIREFGTPLRFTYLPKISENIQKAKKWFTRAMKIHDYEGTYNYCYCTKSSHFSHVLEEALKNDIYLETSAAYDLDIIEKLHARGSYSRDRKIICNGFKTKQYLEKIISLYKAGFTEILPVLDNFKEFDELAQGMPDTFNMGLRIASEEEPKFDFYTSRLGIGYKDILPFYLSKIQQQEKAKLKMLHFFINTGIKDTAYYWSELAKCLNVYVQLKKHCPELDCLNIGGGFPIKNSLEFEYDYQGMTEYIIENIKKVCLENNVQTPHIFTEFGSFTVGESGGNIYKVVYQKQQNDRERWNMIDSSFITSLPDSWAINSRFVMLPINRWFDPYERVMLGGITCDSDDFYNSEQHTNAIYLPQYQGDKPLYLGFFNTGAYQDNIGGFGGIQHCLIPNMKFIIIDKDTEEEDEFTYKVFSPEQSAEHMLNILGY
jgi:arginine decarboxylase